MRSIGPPGRTRSSGAAFAIDERDVYERHYLNEDGVPIPIELDAVLPKFRTQSGAKDRVARALTSQLQAR